MKLLAFTKRPGDVCYRYRVGAFAQALAAAGWTIEAVPLAENTLERTRQLRAAREADVVLLQRRLLPLWQLWLLRRSSPKLIYDFDDAIFLRDDLSGKGPTSWKRKTYFRATVAAADAVIAGNGYLREHASYIAGDDRVHLIPTCIHVQDYPVAKHVRQGPDARLVWIGQRSTIPYAASAGRLLSSVCRRMPGLSLTVIADVFPRVDEVPILPVRWTAESEAAELAETDIGISWLPDMDWSRGKCGLKVLQYMAAGLPVVANPVGMNAEMVVDGETGFLVQTAEEWTLRVEQLANDPGQRRRMGDNGRRLVERRFSIGAHAPRFVQIVSSLAGVRSTTSLRPANSWRRHAAMAELGR